MSETVIKVQNLSKVYRVGEWGTGTISHDLNRWWKTRILRQEDPYAKVGQTNDRTQKAQKGEFVWALKDINFEVKQGEVLGIIGKNGAGKSTLLKVLSRITAPTTGQALIKGRVASLLEVGTGFHPEMTGRENIYLNGTINGMTRPEITRKLDEIVDFAGVAKYLDTPVKRYSSGMTVRLGFAVAAFLEPEILIVDEVLAVGDAEFQKKAIGKMQDVSKGEGRTVLFVSHNMASIKNICKDAILLRNGTIDYSGEVMDVVDYYAQSSFIYKRENQRRGNEKAIIHKAFLCNKTLDEKNLFYIGDDVYIYVCLLAVENIKNLFFSINITDKYKELITHVTNEDDNFIIKDLKPNDTLCFKIKLEKVLIAPGKYFLSFWIGETRKETTDELIDHTMLSIEQGNIVKRNKALPNNINFYQPTSWEYV